MCCRLRSLLACFAHLLLTSVNSGCEPQILPMPINPAELLKLCLPRAYVTPICQSQSNEMETMRHTHMPIFRAITCTLHALFCPGPGASLHHEAMHLTSLTAHNTHHTSYTVALRCHTQGGLRTEESMEVVGWLKL